MQETLIFILILTTVTMIIQLIKYCHKNMTYEISQKIIHMLIGCMALACPYIFEINPRFIYLGIIILIWFIKKLNKNIRMGIMKQDKLMGEIYFIISITVLFVVHKSLVDYVVPILVLTFVDFIVKITEKLYKNINIYDQRKTKIIANSMVFFISVFVCVFLPLKFMTNTRDKENMAISLVIAMLSLMTKLVCEDANDNLMVPLLLHSFLVYNINMTLHSIFMDLAVMLLVIGVGIFLYKNINISKQAVIYFIILCYMFIIQCGIIWILPPAVLFWSSGSLPGLQKQEKYLVLTSDIVERNVFTGVVCSWCAIIFPQYASILYLAFSLSFACTLILNSYKRFISFLYCSSFIAFCCGLTKAILFLALPVSLITGMGWHQFILYITLLLMFIFAKFLLRKWKNLEKTHANELLVACASVIFIMASGLM